MVQQYNVELILSLKKNFMDNPIINPKFIKKVKRQRKQKEVVHEIKNPWLSSVEKKKKSFHNTNPLTETIAYLTSLLNKITVLNSNIIYEKIKKIRIADDKYYVELIKVIYDKCTNEINFIGLYIGLINQLENQWQNCKATFINICEQNYLHPNKNIAIGNTHIVGTLFNMNMISKLKLEEYLNLLLHNTNKELSINLICKLFDCVHDNYKNIDYIMKLKQTDLSSKNKFAIMDILDKYNDVDVKNYTFIEEKHNVFDAFVSEYLDILDEDELIECYNECNENNKEYLLYSSIIDIYVEKINYCDDLFDLLTILIKKQIINKNNINEYIKKLNIEELRIDNGKIDHYLDKLMAIL
jgi:hypothetical protein